MGWGEFRIYLNLRGVVIKWKTRQINENDIKHVLMVIHNLVNIVNVEVICHFNFNLLWLETNWTRHLTACARTTRIHGQITRIYGKNYWVLNYII